MKYHDVALQNLPVTLCLDRAGLVGEDGATHHGCYDMSVYRSIPGAIIAAPADEIELKDMMYSAMLNEGGPYIIRYPRGYGEGKPWQEHEFTEMKTGKGTEVIRGSRIALVCAGPTVYRAAEAAERIKEETGWTPSIYNIRYIKPLDTSLLDEVIRSHDVIITVEDGTILGGLHGAVSEYSSTAQTPKRIVPVGIPDRYINQGTQREQRSECGLDSEGIYAAIMAENEILAKKE